MIVTPKDCRIDRISEIASAFSTDLEQIPVRDNSPLHKLSPVVTPYFYCIEALELAHPPGRYLYIDADTLCVGSLEPLDELALSSVKPLAACSHGRPMPDRQLVLGLQTQYHYFNAGVLLFDSEYLQARLTCNEVIEYYQKNVVLCRFREQCALNALLRDQVQYLPLQYNYLSWMRERNARHTWHDQAVNPMASSLLDARKNLVISHLSAGAVPDRLPKARLEPIDEYWLMIQDHLRNGTDPRSLPDYSRSPNN